MVNIIGDIAGQYNTLMELLKKMPDEEVISVGDMIDRGPRSKLVVEWFMKNGKAILGNHEHLMLDYCQTRGTYYDPDCWLWNGGKATLAAYGGEIPEEVLLWAEDLPLYMEIDGNLISHSFVPSMMELEEACDLGQSINDYGESTIIWNRGYPWRREEYKLQIAGHNSQFGFRYFEDEEGKFAYCLDDSRYKKLTGMHLPSREIFQVDYIG